MKIVQLAGGHLAGACAALPIFFATLATAEAQISDNVVRIGVINDQAGPFADLTGPGSVVAARLAIEDRGGKVAGVPIEVVVADHQNKPDIGSTIVRQWIDRDGVDVLVDVPNSAVALAVQELVRGKHPAVIYSGPGHNRLTGDLCSPNSVHWTYDNWALANGVGRAIVKAGGKDWFFLTADYAFGHDLEGQVSAVVKAAGGQVLGTVRHPINTADFGSFLLQAQASKAQIVAVASAGADFTNAVKQAGEFGLTQRGQKLAGMIVTVGDVHGLGLKTAQGLQFVEPFYWDQNDGTRAFAKRFAEKMNGRMPNMIQAGVYASVTHYLKAVEAAKTDDGQAVVKQMKAMPTDDPLFGKGEIRVDGRKLHPMYLFEAKAPAESTGPWDLYKQVGVIAKEEAFKPVAPECALAK